MTDYNKKYIKYKLKYLNLLEKQDNNILNYDFYLNPSQTTHNLCIFLFLIFHNV